MAIYDPTQSEFGRHRGKKIRTGITQQVQALSNQQLAPESIDAYKMSQQMANMGLMGSTKALYNQGAARNMNAALGAASAGRGTLKSIGGIIGQSDISNLQLAAKEEEARRNNMLFGIRAADQLGKQKLALDQFRQQGLFNYYTGKQRARRQGLNSAINAVASVAGAATAAAISGK